MVYTLDEQTGYAEFYMPKVDAVASTWGGITFYPKPFSREEKPSLPHEISPKPRYLWRMEYFAPNVTENSYLHSIISLTAFLCLLCV